MDADQSQSRSHPCLRVSYFKIGHPPSALRPPSLLNVPVELLVNSWVGGPGGGGRGSRNNRLCCCELQSVEGWRGRGGGESQADD